MNISGDVAGYEEEEDAGEGLEKCLSSLCSVAVRDEDCTHMMVWRVQLDSKVLPFFNPRVHFFPHTSH